MNNFKIGLMLLIGLMTGCSGVLSPQVMSVTPSLGENTETEPLVVRIFFSKPMQHQETEDAFSAFLERQSTSLDGHFEWSSDREMVFYPDMDQLSQPDRVKISLSSEALDTDDNPLTSDFMSYFYWKSGSEVPLLVRCFPEDLSTNVPVLSSITMEFSCAMDEASVRKAFTLTPSVDGNLHVDSNLAIWMLEEKMTHGTVYTVQLSKEAASLSGITLTNDFSSAFIAGGDLTRPCVTGVYPQGVSLAWTNGQDKVERAMTNLRIAFNTAMDWNSLYGNISFTPTIGYSLSWQDASNAVLQLDPFTPLTNYRLTVAGGIKSSNGAEALSEFVLEFKTDGFDFAAVQLVEIVVDDTNSWSWSKVNGFLADTVDNKLELSLKFSSATLNLLSFFTGIEIERLYGEGDSILVPRVEDVADSGGGIYVLMLKNIEISNCYQLTLKAGDGGLKDALGNSLGETLEYYFYSDH